MAVGEAVTPMKILLCYVMLCPLCHFLTLSSGSDRSCCPVNSIVNASVLKIGPGHQLEAGLGCGGILFTF